MLDKLILEPGNPFVEQLFTERLADRVEASRELMYTDVPAQETKYAAWVRSLPECAEWSEETIVQNTEYCRAMSRRVRDEGYDEDVFRQWTEARGETFWGPIKVAMDDLGHLFLGDGNRRAIALYLCGRPIEAEVYYRSPTWQATVEAMVRPGVWLYQPFPHPEFAGMPVGRKSVERYELVGKYLKGHGIEKVLELGSNYGAGCVAMARHGLSVTGVEHTMAYEHMQKALFSVSPGLSLESVYGYITKASMDGVGAVVGMSIWHHLSQSVAMLDECIEHVKAAKIQIVELPEPTSAIWPETLVAETGLPKSELTEFVVRRICEKGQYSRGPVLWSDPAYNGRDTVVLNKITKKGKRHGRS